MLLAVYGTERPILCWCAVKKLLTHADIDKHTHRETDRQRDRPSQTQHLNSQVSQITS